MIYAALMAGTVAVLLFLLYLVRGSAAEVRSLEELQARVELVDVAAFRNLVDPGEEDYLRGHLEPKDFAPIQRARLRAALEYVQRAAKSAAFMARLGDAVRHCPDAELARAGQELASRAIELRLHALGAQALLCLLIVAPGARLSFAKLARRYERTMETVGKVSRLQHPAYPERVSWIN